MKKLVSILVVFSLFFIACNKADDVETSATAQQAVGENQTVKMNDDGQVDFRGPGTDCCCQMVISSTYFGGMTICGVGPQYANSTCTGSTNSCGSTGTVAQVLTKPGIFCPNPGHPFCITNDGNRDIDFSFSCSLSSSGTFTLAPMATLCFEWDCNGSITPCP